MSLTLANAYAAAQSPQAVVLAHIVRDNVREIFGNALQQLGVSASNFKLDGNPYDIVSEDGSQNLGAILEKDFAGLAKTILGGNEDESSVEYGAATEDPAAEASPEQRAKWISEIYKLNNHLRSELGMGVAGTGVAELQDGEIKSAAEFETAVGALLKQTLGQEYDGFSAVSAQDSAASIITKNQDDLSVEALYMQGVKFGLRDNELLSFVGGKAWEIAKSHPNNPDEQSKWLGVVKSCMVGIENLKEAAHTR